MISIRTGVLGLAFAAMFVFAVEMPVNAATMYTTLIVQIREGGSNYSVEIPVTWTEYGNNEPCGNSAHRTKDLKEPDPSKRNPRYFKHAHISFSLPINGKRVEQGAITNDDMTVTEAKIAAFWDHWAVGQLNNPERPNATYVNYGSATPIDNSRNCWAYAFDYSTWIQDPAYIYEDDYYAVNHACVWAGYPTKGT